MPSNNPTYRSWHAMKHRCSTPYTNGYKSYGGRGITVCERWMNFKNFVEDMGERPEGSQLDRIDVNGHYCKDNCRWATKHEQANNRQNTKWVTCFGKKVSLADAARITGLNEKSLGAFLNRNKSFVGDISEIHFTPQKKLTESQVLEIRSSKEGARPLAVKFNVSRSLIRSVRQGLSWKKLL